MKRVSKSTEGSASPGPVFPLHLTGPPLVRNLSSELAAMLDPLLIISDAAKAEAEEEAREQELLVVPVLVPVVSPLVAVVAIPSTVAVIQRKEDTNIKVLVVEDNAISRRILTTFLKTKAIPFEEATNGEEAVEKYKSFLPNLVWCDIQMPIMVSSTFLFERKISHFAFRLQDGIQATTLIREFELENNLLPAHIVALTGLSSESRLHKASLTSGQCTSFLFFCFPFRF